MEQLRLLLVRRVFQENMPVTRLCRELGLSRPTAYKWLRKYAENQRAAS